MFARLQSTKPMPYLYQSDPDSRRRRDLRGRSTPVSVSNQRIESATWVTSGNVCGAIRRRFCCPVPFAARSWHRVPDDVIPYRNCRAHIDHTFAVPVAESVTTVGDGLRLTGWPAWGHPGRHAWPSAMSHEAVPAAIPAWKRSRSVRCAPRIGRACSINWSSSRVWSVRGRR